jgi:hypothetical protein
VEQVVLSWPAVVGATSYNVKRSITAGGSYSTVACVSSLSYTDTGLTGCTAYYYVVCAVNPAGESTNSVEVSARPTTSFTAYQQRNFSLAQLAYPGISGPLTDANGDGVNNLLAYASGISPWTTATDANGGLPITQIQNDHLTIRFVQLTCAIDLMYVVEVSDDLITWNSGPTYTTELAAATLDAARTQVTVRDNVPVSVANRRFMRIRIAQLPP